MSALTPDAELHPDAHALGAARIVGPDELRIYTATTFPNDPWRGCNHMLRMLRATDGLAKIKKDDYAVLDVFNENGDIVQDFALTRSGFKFAYRKLDWRVVDLESELAAVSGGDETAARRRRDEQFADPSAVGRLAPIEREVLGLGSSGGDGERDGRA